MTRRRVDPYLPLLAAMSLAAPWVMWAWPQLRADVAVLAVVLAALVAGCAAAVAWGRRRPP